MAKDYLKNLKVSVGDIIRKYAKWNYITVGEIRDLIKKDEDFIWDSRVREELADNYGILSHITSAINSLRKGDKNGNKWSGGLPIISGKHGDGYTWAGNFKRSDIADVWCDKFDENEKRKKIPISEKQIDDQLFLELLKKATKAEMKGNIEPEIRKKLLVVQEKYKIKKKIAMVQ